MSPGEQAATWTARSASDSNAIVASVEGEPDGAAKSGDPGHRIDIDVPATYSSLRVLRLVVADAVDDAGLSAERVERAGVVIDELAAVLVADGVGERMAVQVVRSGSSVSVQGVIASGGDTAGEAPLVDDVVRELLDLCVGRGHWTISRDRDELRIDAVIS